jgi:site-specific recombinase XerD
MIDDLRIRNRSADTIRIYIDCVKHFARHFGKSPELLGPEEIRQYQVYLVNERHVSSSYLTQTVCALRFLYCVTLQRDWAITRIPHPKQPRRLPIVLSQTEVKQLFDSIRSLKYRALLMTAYAGGLRTSEVVQLRLTDIDSQRMVIRIRQGKGQKDRYVMLAPTLLKVLRQYWQQDRPTNWLFPGQAGKQPISRHRVAEMCKQLGVAAGVDVVKIKELMGHASIVTTMRYIHATDQGKRGAIVVLSEYRQRHQYSDCRKFVANEKRQTLKPAASR